MVPQGDEVTTKKYISEASIDCRGREFFCVNADSYLMCGVQPDNSTRTISTEILYCPPETYCDHNYGEFECDSPVTPSTSTRRT